ncbi:hypothetical protein [uncultured Corynebacterium sp.]|uniref:hypothetical protein n=1 Tax=uncultured Corynebacterium sp. TaxID=159447 RepID=UPI0025E9D61A|nr:hypothetical protein [uncultured Corynebacterium sp.]
MTSTGSRRAASVFVFDGDCGLCGRAASMLERITDSRDDGTRADARVPSFAVIAHGDFDFASNGVALEIIERHALYVESRGGHAGNADKTADPPPFVALGHRAIGHALHDHARSRWWRLAGRVLLHPLMDAPAAIVYRLVADNRHRIGPLLPGPRH